MTHVPQIIVCAGIPRSGSTWLFNAVRLLHEHDGKSVCGRWVDEYDSAESAEVHVIKVHNANKSLRKKASCVLMTQRDLRDVAASLRKKGWVESDDDLIAYLDGVVDAHAYWRAIASLELAYDSITSNSAACIARVAEALAMHPSPIQIRSLDQTLGGQTYQDDDGQAFDRTNLMHPGHKQDGRSGYFTEVLSDELIKRINDRFEAWLSAYGYITT